MKKIMNIYVFILLVVMGHQITSSDKSVREAVRKNDAPKGQDEVISALGGTGLTPLVSLGVAIPSAFVEAPFVRRNLREDLLGMTGLHRAVYNGDIPMIQALILFGADINALDSEGRTPLQLAIDMKRSPVMIQLLMNSLIESALADSEI